MTDIFGLAGFAAAQQARAVLSGNGSAADRAGVAAMVRAAGSAPTLLNNRVAVVGNSFGEHGKNNSDTRLQYTSVGPQHWTSVLGGARCVFPMEYNFAVSGAKSDAIIAGQLSAAMATDAAVVLCPNMTINDHRGSSGGATNLPWATTKANIDTLVAACRAAGKHLIIGNDPGIGTSAITGQRYSSDELAMRNKTNRYLASLNGTPRVTVLDLDALVSLRASSLGDVNAIYSRDALHLNQLGWLVASRDLIVPEMARLLPARSILPASNSDKWSIDNPQGCLNPNPMLTNTGGTSGAGGGTVNGTIAQGSTIGMSSGAGVTVTGSIVQVGDFNYQRMVITGTPTAGATQVTFYQLIDTTALVPGVKVAAAMDIIVAAGSTGIQDVSSVLSLRDAGGTEVMQARQGGYTPSDALLPAIGWSGPYETPEVAVPGALGVATRVMGRVTLIQNVAANITIDIGRIAARVSA